MKRSIKGIEIEELAKELQRHGYEQYRARQICFWLYKSKALGSFDDMTDLPKELRAFLAENFFVDSLSIKETKVSTDGTRKILFCLKDEHAIESVLLPDPKKPDTFTLCVSTQVGCPLDCSFCLTGKIGFIRNLCAPEIIDQVLISRRDFLNEEQILRNLVFMGMGEPLLNAEAVITALRFLTSPQYCEISPRRVTISTSGIVPGIRKLAASNLQVNLAISLNATNNQLRSYLMPINKKYKIEEIIAACRAYPLPQRRRITFEYVMLKDVNDSLEDASRLAKLLLPLRCKINLIVYNPVEELPYQPSSPEQIKSFQQFLREKNYTVAIRYSRGQDILAACGQLAAIYPPNAVVK